MGAHTLFSPICCTPPTPTRGAHTVLGSAILLYIYTLVQSGKKRGKIVHPNNIQKRRMLSKAIEIMIIAGMENHVYKFGDATVIM